MTNPNIADAGLSTRFGSLQGPDPRGRERRLPPWSVKKHVRRLMYYPLEQARMPSEYELLEWLRGADRSCMTISMLVAVQRVCAAMASGHEMIRLIDYVEGRSRNRSVNTLLSGPNPSGYDFERPQAD